MGDDFSNVYADDDRAASYDRLEFPGTYYLAFRDLPGLLRKHVIGRRALDFGCGTGRSTRFLRDQGFGVVGVDIAESMLTHARTRDPQGDYRLVPDGDLSSLPVGGFDLILSAFTFDNVPTLEKKLGLFTALQGLLSPKGRLVNLVSAPEIYTHEWTSFSTRNFPENKNAASGSRVKIIMLDVEDRRPVEDMVCSDTDYRGVYAKAGLDLLETHRPLGRPSEPYAWVSETSVAPAVARRG